MNLQKQYWGMQQKPYCMLIHTSQLLNFFAPGFGFLLPIVMWIAQKDKNEEIDKHGRITINWMISFTIYFVIFFIIAFVFFNFVGLVIITFVNLNLLSSLLSKQTMANCGFTHLA